MLVLDPRLEVAVDGLQEVLAVKVRVEAEDRAAEQSIEDLARQGQMPNDSGFGQGMCQNARMVAAGSARRIIARQQREVIVLDQHDRVVAARLGHDGVGEALVDRAVLLPVAFAEHRPHVSDMAKRPQALVGEAVVIALLPPAA